MTAAGPWSVKGIDPKARELAKDMARRSGLTLGEWLNQMITDGLPAEPPPAGSEAELRAVLLAEAAAGDEIAQAVDEEAAAASQAEVERVTQLLETVSDRIEAAEHRSTLAISGIDQSVLGVLSRLEALDREQSGSHAQFRASFSEVRDAQAKVAERVRRMEQEDGSRVEALRALESALSRVATQIHDGSRGPGEGGGHSREELESLSRRVTRVEIAADGAPSAYADGDRTRSELEQLGRRMNRVEATSDASPNVFANAGQTREELDGLVRRLTRVEASAETAPNLYADADITHEALEGLSRRVVRVESAADGAPDLYAEADQVREEFDGVTRRLSRVEAAAEVAPNVFANAGQTREELDGLVRRMSRVEAATEAAPNLYADATQTRSDLDGSARRIARVEAAVDAAPAAFADGSQTRQQLEGLTGRMSRVEAFADAAPRAYAGAGKTREELEAVVRRVARVESAVESAPSAFADAGHTRDELDAVGRRLMRVEGAMESAPKAYADAEKVETVLSRLAERLERAESRTTAAVQSLESSFAGLDARMRTTESRLGRDAQPSAELDRRFQTLAAELSQKVEANRSEFAQRLRTTAADGRLEQVEVTLKDISGHLDRAERRSAQALEHIGREVVNVAKSLGDRMTTVEDRSSTAIHSLGADIGRLTDTVDGRLRIVETTQSEALTRLGDEIGRIAERLTERLAGAERRSADGLDEVGGQLSELRGAVTERHDRAGAELTDRIRLSEERTARLIAEARETMAAAQAAQLAEAAPPDPEPPVLSVAAAASDLDARISAPHGWAEPHAPEPASPDHGVLHAAPDVPDPPAYEPDPFEIRAAEPTSDSFDADDEFEPFEAFEPFRPFEATASAPAYEPPIEETTAYEPPVYARVDAQGAAHAAVHAPAARALPDDALSADAMSDDAGLHYADAPQGRIGAVPDAYAEAPPEPMARHDAGDAPPPAAAQSTRDMIEAARASARRGGREAAPLGPIPAPPLDKDTKTSRPFGLTFRGKRKKDGVGGPTLRTVFLASGWAAAITTAVIGAHALSTAGGASKPATTPVPADELARTAPTAAEPGGKADLAVALVPSAAAGATPQDHPATGVADPGRTAYEDATRRIEAGDDTGVAALRHAANLGDSPAQFYLGRLYEAGSAGLPKDLAQARVWTERAANGGLPEAMYNLASYAYAGEGGPRDLAAAAGWFRRAAEHGVVNGQYNLAQLYEKGYGVPQSTSDAYKWYEVAAASGDAEARAGADTLRRQLAPDAASAMDRDAQTLRGQIALAARTASPQTPGAPVVR